MYYNHDIFNVRNVHSTRLTLAYCNKLELFLVAGVRLVGGKGEHEGIVEILLNGDWGTICSNSLDQNAANVVCRQVGFGVPATSLDGLIFGTSTTQSWLTVVECDGDEPELSNCTHTLQSARISCPYTNTAAVRCSSKF